jgi:hypothetical protein
MLTKLTLIFVLWPVGGLINQAKAPKLEYTLTGEISLNYTLSEIQWDFVYYHQDFNVVKARANKFASRCERCKIKYYRVYRQYLRNDNNYYAAIVKKIK